MIDCMIVNGTERALLVTSEIARSAQKAKEVDEKHKTSSTEVHITTGAYNGNERKKIVDRTEQRTFVTIITRNTAYQESQRIKQDIIMYNNAKETKCWECW